MSQETWSAVDRYFSQTLVPSDPVLDDVLRANATAGLPAIDVAPNQGKLLHLLARIHKAKRILEIGTLGAYSTIWMARALPPEGKLVTLEANPKHAAVASANITRAGFDNIVELRIGQALGSLAKMQTEGVEAFDLIFIDADKPNNPGYLEWALRFSRPGTVILLDNVVRDGGVVDDASEDPAIAGVRQFFSMLTQDPRLDATAIQTVGSKGYDGFALVLVK
jgi:predicted O-methyltransferase YrrM